ncbi:uncharacterized protein DUF1524 [Rhodovulum bhavnagarense]|uniref:Uncharacterized protein DUF1524 n=1 Tax=Rhodovulum bhavnagarense TaxID=992286 RepID=A0A4R2RWE7_9RHOB|nr:DUF262 domain-containing protein [Rhodovulum bhavnagarense]TCP63455.1 uncharacterized protein DUF1524 [Rhodovulum bhavnagarense]
MDAKAHDLNFVLGQRQQWVVPVYQRHYEWETDADKQIPKLWDDLRDKATERLDEDRTPLPHYFGAIIYSEPTKQAFGAVPVRFLVDGQQRITTFQIVLVAIREVARKIGIKHLVEVTSTYLFNDENKGMKDVEKEKFKLWPSSYDRQLFQKIATEEYAEVVSSFTPSYFHGTGRIKKGGTPKLLRAYHQLYTDISTFVDDRVELGDEREAVLSALLEGFLAGFQIVVIQLDENDDAQEIFASLNGLGKPLAPFDLIRNSIFHRARKLGEDDEKLFDGRWKLFEEPFWTDEVRQGRLKRARADHLIAHTVVAETARDANIGKIATEYQHYARDRAFTTVAEELDVLIRHAKNYRLLEDAKEDTTVGQITNVLRVWDLSTFHPFVLWILSYVSDEHEKSQILKLLESYLVRRELCGLTTKNYNKVTTSFIRAAKSATDTYDAFSKHMMSMTGDISKMPTDAQVKEAVLRRKAYGVIPTPRLRFILQNVEYDLRDKFDEVTVSTSNLTIEHVMPRKWAENWPLSDDRVASHESSFEAMMAGVPMDDGMKALVEARARAVDTIGNLTLITGALNPSLSNAGWTTKREKLSGSLLALNRMVAKVETWGEKSIEARAETIGDVIIRHWGVPKADQ